VFYRALNKQKVLATVYEINWNCGGSAVYLYWKRLSVNIFEVINKKSRHNIFKLRVSAQY
jgi:hypothetical protein